jgi:hypothetical protein
MDEMDADGRFTRAQGSWSFVDPAASVTRVCFDERVTLLVDTGEFSFEVALSGAFEISGRGFHRRVTSGDSNLDWVQRLRNEKLDDCTIWDDGRLQLTVGEVHLVADADPLFEAWEINGETLGVVSLPGGGIDYWVPDE